LSADLELWTQRGGDLTPHLPRTAEWRSFGDEFQFNGGDWVVSAFAPEQVEPYQAPPELQDLVDGLHFHIELGVEPADADDAAHAFVREVMETLGRALGGAAIDPETSEPRSWAS
jgi:hypothetical protein